MASTQVFIVIYASPSNLRFKSLRRTMNNMYLAIFLGFSGCLFLDPLRFISCHLLVTVR